MRVLKKLAITSTLFSLLFVVKSTYGETVVERTISNNQGYELDLSDNEKHINILIPVGSIGADVELKFSFDPIISAVNVNKDNLQASLNEFNPPLHHFSNHVYELVLYSGGELFTDTFYIPLKIEISYLDTDQNGIVDNLNPMIFEDTLTGYSLDGQYHWNSDDEQERDAELNVITMYISKAGVYTLSGLINYSETPDRTKIYPNPYMPGVTAQFNASGITFDRLTTDSIIQIYTPGGELVKELKETNTDGRIVWDVKNSAGKDAVSGVYMALIHGKNQKKVYRFAIER